MRTGNVTLKVGKSGSHSDVRIKGVTPAEVVILTHEDDDIGHMTNCGGFPLSKLEITGDALALAYDDLDGQWKVNGKVLRTDKEELERLQRKYKPSAIKACFPGASPKLPQDFSCVSGWDADTDGKVVEADKPAPTKTEPPKK